MDLISKHAKVKNARVIRATAMQKESELYSNQLVRFEKEKQ